MQRTIGGDVRHGVGAVFLMEAAVIVVMMRAVLPVEQGVADVLRMAERLATQREGLPKNTGQQEKQDEPTAHGAQV